MPAEKCEVCSAECPSNDMAASGGWNPLCPPCWWRWRDGALGDKPKESPPMPPPDPPAEPMSIDTAMRLRMEGLDPYGSPPAVPPAKARPPAGVPAWTPPKQVTIPDEPIASFKEWVGFYPQWTDAARTCAWMGWDAARRAAVAEIERLRTLPEWIIQKLKTLGEYYEPPTDGRNIVSEVQGWMHVLCFHYVQNRREVKEFSDARRRAKELTDSLAAARQQVADLTAERDAYRKRLDDAVSLVNYASEETVNLRAERDEAVRQVAALREGLRPFAEARLLPGAPEGGYLIGWLDEHDGMLTVGDVLNALALLAAPPGAAVTGGTTQENAPDKV